MDITQDMNELVRRALLGATFEFTFEEIVPCLEAHPEAVFHPDGHRVTRTFTGTLTNLTFKERT